MFDRCPHCGGLIEDFEEAAFCDQCGKAIESPIAAENPKTKPPTESAEAPSEGAMPVTKNLKIQNGGHSEQRPARVGEAMEKQSRIDNSAR